MATVVWEFKNGRKPVSARFETVHDAENHARANFPAREKQGVSRVLVYDGDRVIHMQESPNA